MGKRMPVLTAAVLIVAMGVGCSHRKAGDGSAQSSAKVARGAASASTEKGGEHKAMHGGSLNAIVACENGHAEVKVDGDRLQLWFVGGGTDTDKSVRVPDRSIRIQVRTDTRAQTLVLNPKPLELAGETVGDCSCFESTAPWLKSLAAFTAEGQITFKGQKRPLRIEYPKGYDPD